MKVYCVFESSEHTDIYERDNDGMVLVDIYADEKKACGEIDRLFQQMLKNGNNDIEENSVTSKSLTHYCELANGGHEIDSIWNW